MLVLHGAWGVVSEAPPTGRLFIWAESSGGHPDASSAPPSRRGRRHPFAAQADEVEAALFELAQRAQVGRFDDVGTTQSNLLSLSSTAAGPMPSPRLVFDTLPEHEIDRQPIAVQPWLVPGVIADLEIALRVLADMPMHDEPVAGAEPVVFGGDLRFWSHAAKLALELTVRQRFIPTISVEDKAKSAPSAASPAAKARPQADGEHAKGHDRARAWAWWAPVLDDPSEQERVATLAAALPGSAVALLEPTAAGTLSVRRRQTVEHFVTTAVDMIVRFSNLAAYPGSREADRLRSISPAERWFRALHDDPLLRGRIDELATLSEQVNGWTAELRSGTRADGFRTCFRLEPPESDDQELPPTSARGKKETGSDDPGDGRWRLRFFLQAIDDRSLLVPAEEVWQAQGPSLIYHERRFDRAQDRFLADLGRALRVFPALESALRTARPVLCRLTDEQAHSFLSEGAWLLEDSGFGVLVPGWWSRRGRQGPRLGVRLRVSGEKGAVRNASWLGMSTLVNYDWELALGEEKLTEEEFKRLANLKTPLVHLRGQWVELGADQIRAIRKLWKDGGQSESMTLGQALGLSLGQGEAVDALPVLGLETSGWPADLLDNLTNGERLESVEVPPRFNGTLRPYQERGLSWLVFLRKWGLGACLADDMGLGKTIQLLALLLHLERERQEQRRKGRPPGEDAETAAAPALVVCPTSVVTNWAREAARFAPDLRVMVHQGNERLKGEPFQEAVAAHDMVVTSYALLRRDQKAFIELPWDCVVLDEAQNIKNVAAQVTQVVRKLQVGHRIALTGTPVENRLSELWSIMEFLNPGYLGPLARFKRDLATPIERYEDPKATRRLRGLIQPFLLRRLKTDPTIISDLPEKQEMKVFCSLTREQATLYEAIVQDSLKQIEESDGIQRKGVILATLMKLKQVCNHPAQFLKDGSALPGRSGKLNRLTEMLAEVIEEGDRALVFTQFAVMGRMLQSHLQLQFGREVLYLHGQTPAQQRGRIVERFQEEADAPAVFLLSLKAGGTGLNLTRARHVFHFDRWWNPAVEDQATDRAFRIGQTQNVQVHKFLCAATVEEQIDAMIESKKGLAASVVSAGESWLTELSTDTLREMLQLGPGAVIEE